MAKPFSQLKTCHVVTVDITARFIILGFLRFLKQQGQTPTVVASFGKFKPMLEQEGFRLKDIPMTRSITPLQDVVTLWRLFWYFKQERFDLVHTYTPKAGVLGRIAARLAGTPIVLHTSYGFYVGQQLEAGVMSAILFGEKVAARFCDRVYSQNQEDVVFAIKEGVVPAGKIQLQYYGINLDRFRPGRMSQEAVALKKQQLGLAGKTVIGMVGRFVQEKGYLDLFAAFAKIRQQHPEAVLLLVAPKDPEKDDALDRSVLDEYGINDAVVLLGHEREVDDMENVYPLMDLFVLPSYREGFPFSIMEASASGLPVIATDIRGCREAVEQGVTGILVPAGNADALASAMHSFLADSVLRSMLGNAGRIKAEKDFNEQTVFSTMKQEYESFAARL